MMPINETKIADSALSEAQVKEHLDDIEHHLSVEDRIKFSNVPEDTNVELFELLEKVNEIVSLPPAPTIDGYYALRLRVESGIPQYDWVEVL